MKVLRLMVFDITKACNGSGLMVSPSPDHVNSLEEARQELVQQGGDQAFLDSLIAFIRHPTVRGEQLLKELEQSAGGLPPSDPNEITEFDLQLTALEAFGVGYKTALEMQKDLIITVK